MRKAFFLSVLLSAYLSCHAIIPIAPIPAWVKQQSLLVSASIPPAEVSNGFYYMLLDEQINLEKKQFYNHYAYKIISEAGVQNSSELNFSYNPAYEKFTFHSLKVYRNGKYIDRTHSTLIKEIQRETGFEEHLYDESMSVLLVLEDIRPGDIIEYDYSTVGSNPIFEGKFYYNFYFSYEYELLEVNLRLLKPASRKINERTFNTTISPQKKITNGEEEIIYHATHIKGLNIEKKIPASFNPYYSIEFSEYDNWQQVQEWAKNVFSVKTPNSDLLIEKAKEIKDSFPDKDKQVIAALRFVQNQIRYMGVEIGVNSHKPADPNKVILQRYGDCKDKSLLFCKILEGLDIKAYPALVSTTDRHGIKNNLVSPRIFNHCISKVELNGTSFWFDPTISYQKGDLHHYYTPNYELALVIGSNVSELEEMPQNTFSKITTEETYDIPDFSGKATLKIKTIYKGADADNMRGDFANSSTKSTSETLLNYYKTYFSEISEKSPPKTEDEDSTDTFILYEEYAIHKFWEYPDSTNKKKVAANIYAYMIREKLRAYDATFADRKMPMYLEYPTDVEQKTHLILPENWEVKIDDDVKHTEFIDFKYLFKSNKNTIDIDLEYKSLTNEIPANKAKAFVALLDDLLTNNSALRITFDKSLLEQTPQSMNWLMLILFILFLGIFIFIAVYIYKQNPKYELTDENGLLIKPREIGGWMILPIIGLVISPFSRAYIICTNNYFNLHIWHAHTDLSGSSYHPLWAPGLISELVFNTLTLVLSILVLCMLFTHDKRFPKYFMFLFIAQILGEVITCIILSNIPTVGEDTVYSTTKSVVRLFVSAIIWIPYFYTSERSKETFIR